MSPDSMYCHSSAELRIASNRSPLPLYCAQGIKLEDGPSARSKNSAGWLNLYDCSQPIASLAAAAEEVAASMQAAAASAAAAMSPAATTTLQAGEAGGAAGGSSQSTAPPDPAADQTRGHGTARAVPGLAASLRKQLSQAATEPDGAQYRSPLRHPRESLSSRPAGGGRGRGGVPRPVNI